MRIVRPISLIFLLSLAAAQSTHDLATAARRALAITSGTLQARGLQQAVEVLRDRWGVAHIYAQNQHDLFFAQGFVAAQDRLFQMELWKRAGQGRLAEIVGPSALPRDVNARLLRYRGDMQREYESYSPDAKEILQAFADGINSYIGGLSASGGPGLPVEFALAGFAPDSWHPEDCLNRMAAFSMTGNAFSELEHAQAVAAVGAAEASKVFRFDPTISLDPAPGLDFTGLSRELLKNLIGSDDRIELPANAVGSNNWTISGALTVSGKPLLANDPHRVIALPSLRYMVHLVAPGWDVIGAGEPGLPGVALGHNEHIAWGFTIFALDQQDLYLEDLNPADPMQYKTEGGWQRMEVQHGTFNIKGEAPKEVDLKFTRHGPVLWDDSKRALALRWSGSEPGTAGYLASLAVDRARNWEQFESAVARWKLPPENLAYADDAGNIGEHSAGLVPLRRWTGLLPVPGAAGYEWSGFVPVSELPHSFNPNQRYIATANHKMIPEHYPYNVGFEWDSGERIRRIRSVLDEAKRTRHKIALPDMEALQNDVTSQPALELQKVLHSTSLKNDPSLRSFFRWNGRLSRNSADAALYEIWCREISHRLADRLARRRGKQLQYLRGRYQALPPSVIMHMLSSVGVSPAHKPPQAAASALDRPTRDQLLAMSLKSAREQLAKLLGPDSSQWSWGKLHTVRFRHPLDLQLGTRDLLDLGPLVRPGDEYTVNSTGGRGESREQSYGASYREILDTSDWDRSLAINTPGQSGQPGSPHYSDLMRLWDEGHYFPLLYSRKAVEAATTERLTLEP
jgi:penicillin G amidase